MNLDKTFRTERCRTFLIDALPEPLTRASEHIQIFDNYIHETRLRLRSIRVPETKEWTYILQQRFRVTEDGSEWNLAEIFLNEGEYEHFKVFEGNEIRKNRHFHEFDGRPIAFDIYLGALWGLNRARVEFETLKELHAFKPPTWAVVEITDRIFFDDAHLVNTKFENVQDELAAVEVSSA